MENDKKPTKKTDVFMMTAETALMFYDVCQKLNITDPSDKAVVLHTMAKMGLMDGLYTTERSPDKIVEDFKKNFKVADLRKKSEDSTNGC